MELDIKHISEHPEKSDETCLYPLDSCPNCFAGKENIKIYNETVIYEERIIPQKTYVKKKIKQHGYCKICHEKISSYVPVITEPGKEFLLTLHDNVSQQILKIHRQFRDHEISESQYRRLANEIKESQLPPAKLVA